MPQPKMTVVIPTRQRCDVLESSLRTVMAQDYEALEIVVSDNCSTDDTESLVRSMPDPRIRYVNTGRRLSMSHNWEFALSHVTGPGWVTILGDDDALLPGALKQIAELIDDTKVQAIRTNRCRFYWPTVTGEKSGRLIVPTRSGFEVRDSSNFLSRVLSGVGPYNELPLLYTGGYVDLAVIDKLRAHGGSVYRSRIPDIYMGVAIASVVDRYLYSNENSAIDGISGHSTGRSQFKLPVSEPVSSSPSRAFDSEQNIPFHESIPLSENGAVPGSLLVLVYESFLQTEFLRNNDESPRPQLQLERVLATSEMDRAETAFWATAFATMHDLDYRRAARRSHLRRLALLPGTVARRARNGFHRHGLGTESAQITDVHQAAEIASSVIAEPPSAFSRTTNLAAAAWAELAGRR